MGRKSRNAVASFLAVAATTAWAGDYSVERTLNVASSSEEAWHVAGDFCDIDDWHPAIASCTLKVMDGSLHRVLVTADGAEFVEKRIAEEPGLSYTYQIVSSPLPLEKYTATFSITRGSSSTITWSGRWSSDDPATEDTFTGIYETGLSGIADKLDR